MSSFKNLFLSRKLHEACLKTLCNISQPPTWSVHRSLHASYVYYKKHSADKEAVPLAYQKLKSKYKEKEVISVWKNMTVSELGEALHKDANYVLEVLTYVNDSEKYRKPSQVIDNFKVIEHVVKKVGKRIKTVAPPTQFEKKEEHFQDVTRRSPLEYKDVRPRPPVVTIMGHVDHGKTTLLDSLRNSAIVDSEFGGITQHIGAFSVTINEKEKITFLDTPGHAAFCSMRNRGAQCTDIVILVVAADDGVMEQTVESIKMANDANVPIIVAVNKIDKPQADVERTKKMLMTHGIQVEDMGGDVQMVPISALKGTNIDNLMEAVTVQADLMALKSDYSGAVEGVIIESSTDPHRGKLCTLLVQCGTLKKSAVLVAGDTWCKVRAIFNDNGDPIQLATPSTPVQILGWKDLPSAGDVVIQVPSERKATEIIEWRRKQKDYEKLKEDQEIIDKKMKEEYLKYRKQLEAKRMLGYYRTRQIGPRQKEVTDTDDGPKLNIILKADVNGSLEAILDVLDTYDFPNCKLNVVHYGVGQVSKNDVFLAKTFNAIIYSFNTGIIADAKLDLKSENVLLKRHNVIYKLVDELKSDLSDLLPMLDQEEVIGEANVLQEFLINEGKNKVPVAGCRCVKGKLKKSDLFKVIRGEDEIFSGKLSSLKHFKKEVDTIQKDMDCGVRLTDNTLNFQPGDTIICYKINKIPQKVIWDPGF